MNQLELYIYQLNRDQIEHCKWRFVGNLAGLWRILCETCFLEQILELRLLFFQRMLFQFVLMGSDSERIVSPFTSVSYKRKCCAAQYGSIEVSLDSFSCQWVDFVDHIVARKIFSLEKFHNTLLILQNYYY